MAPNRHTKPTVEKRSLRESAVSGGLWTGAQVVVNKVVSLLGTVVMMFLLLPEEYGLASLATSLLALVTVLAPFTLSDVLLARPADADRLAGTAFWMCAGVTLVTILALLGVAPIAADHYGQPALVGACVVMVLRPVVELMLLGPQTRLRAQLRFKTLASIDAGTQTLATLSGIGMAWVGLGYLSIVLPQIVFTGVRAFLYSRACAPGAASPSWIAGEARQLLRSYALSGLGQYVHGGLVVATPLVIGQFSSDEQVGFYSLAFSLSASINVVVAVSMGLVLQPIFAQMGGDPNRQSAAFLRACRTIAAIAMPVCLLQAALAPAGFHALLPDRWAGSVAMTQVLCIGQAFYFPVNPAMGLLKAQGRFEAFFVWQLLQLVLTIAAMVVAAVLLPEHAALAVVVVSAVCPIVSSPIGVWLSIRHRTSGTGGSLSIFLAPGVCSMLAIAPPYIACEALIPAGGIRDWVELLALPVVSAIVYRYALASIAPELRGDLAALVRPVASRLGLNRTDSRP